MFAAVSEFYDARQEKIKRVFKFLMTYIVWVSLSYFSIHAQARFCAEWSIMGFLSHSFVVNSPHCNALKWLINEGSSSISRLFAMVAIYVATTLVFDRDGTPRKLNGDTP